MPKTYAVPNINTLDNIRMRKVLTDFSGGLNQKSSNEELNDNEAILRQNWSNDDRGAIKKVNGYTKRNATTMGAKPVRMLGRVYLANGTKHLLAMCNGKLFYSTDNGTTFTQETGAVAFTETDFFTGVNFNNLFFFTGLTNNLYKYTVGTTTAAATTSQPTDPCKIVLKRSDRRLLALVNIVNASTLYFSKIDPTGAAADDWSAANDAGSIAIDGALSEALTGGATFGAYDIIFKDYAAFKVWGYPTPQAVRMTGSPGCAAPYSVAQGDGLTFHLAHDGVYMYDGNRFILISDPIKPLIDLINPSYIQNAFGVYREGLYWLIYTYTGQTTNKKAFIYDVLGSNPYTGRNLWYERPLLMNCPMVLQGYGDDNELFAGDSADTGFVYRLDFSSTGADDTANIEGIYQTKYFDFDTPHIVKFFPKIHITYYLAAGNLIATWYTNRGTTSGSFTVPVTQTGTPLGVFVLDTDRLAANVENTHTERLPATAVGKDISIKFTHDATGAPPIIREAEIEAEALYES